MTERTKVSGVQNNFFDSEQIDDADLSLEQNYNNNAQFGLINNHVGSGVLPEVLIQAILFDSDDLSFDGVLLDGKAINTLSQPSDSNLGNQLEIELVGSAVAGQKSVKIAIIGLDFQGDLQYDTFEFHTNEKQVSSKHYTSILTILFNDFKGTQAQSFNLGGRVFIREAHPLTLSRDTVMLAQDVEPNLFFRDFFVAGLGTLQLLLNAALPLYNVDSLGISTSFKENKILAKGDVSSQVGQKFLAKTNNIQKISLLLSVQNTDVGQAEVLNWQGDLIVSVYPLQSSIACSTDIVPNLAIDFSPTNIPLAQLSFNYSSLRDLGVVLNGTPQPVDFIFSNTLIASGNIVPGQYYGVTVKRSGSANQCDILLAAGSDHVDDSRVTIFTGNTWVDIQEEDLWFRIYTDAAKISDGQAYETGHGIQIPKTHTDPSTNSEANFSMGSIEFTGNQLFTGTIFAVQEKNTPVQDQRTGSPVFSRKEFVPQVELLAPIDLASLISSAADPLFVGLISDKNVKSFDSTSSTLSAKLHGWTFVNNEMVLKIIDDVTDPKYDSDIQDLVANVVNGDFVNAKIVPNVADPNAYYRISKTEIVSMVYGDINGDGIVDDRDLVLYNRLLGSDLRSAPARFTTVTDGYNFTDGYTTAVVNGYETFTTFFTGESSLSYKIIDPTNNTVIASGSDGYLVTNPNDGSLANFNSAGFDFNTVSDLTNLRLAILASGTPGNVGSFRITAIDGYVVGNPSHTLNIDKLYYTSETLMQIMRADVDGDFNVTTNDGYFIQNYILRTNPFPPTSLPASKIGTEFRAIRITVDPFLYNDLTASPLVTNRTDNFYTGSSRSVELHPVQDIYFGDGYTGFPGHNFSTPITFNIVKQLSWSEYLVLANGYTRFVPTVFSLPNGQVKNECSIHGIQYEVYPNSPVFDSGVVDTFVPNNVIIGDGGELKRSDGNFYKVDFEVGTIVLEIPDGLFAVERAINIFDDFIADYTGTGVTRLGFPAMRFADCSLVTSEALARGQVRFSVAVQSFSPNTNGTDPDGYTGAVVDGKIGVAMDYETGILTLNFTNLYQDSVLATLNTKVQVSVFLKKGGFNNLPIFIDSFKTQNLLNLISVFSGAGTAGGPISVVDLTSEVVGILPIENGGTGLGSVGPAGTFLVSDGYGLVYKSLQNPLFIPVFHGLGSAQSTAPSAISAFTFRFDEIADGYNSVKLEVILESSNALNTAQIKVFNVTTNSYIVLDTGASTTLTTSNQTPTLLKSIDLSGILGQLAQDYIYELHLSLNPLSATDYAYCKMARLVVLYS